ncbi:MAG: hypothetical protein WCG91_02725 [Candidatus Shapirobacteria bacterium]
MSKRNTVFTAGVVIGVVISVIFVLLINLNKEPIAAQSGMTILVYDDRAVMIEKGTLVQGHAQQLIEADGHFQKKEIQTPFVATESMVVRCSLEGFVCILYADDVSNSFYYRQISQQILK